MKIFIPHGNLIQCHFCEDITFLVKDESCMATDVIRMKRVTGKKRGSHIEGRHPLQPISFFQERNTGKAIGKKGNPRRLAEKENAAENRHVFGNPAVLQPLSLDGNGKAGQHFPVRQHNDTEASFPC